MTAKNVDSCFHRKTNTALFGLVRHCEARRAVAICPFDFVCHREPYEVGAAIFPFSSVCHYKVQRTVAIFPFDFVCHREPYEVGAAIFP
jgi:hypothetical protein